MSPALWWTYVRRSYTPFFLPIPIVILYLVQSSEPSQDWRREWLWSSLEAGRWLVFGGAVIAAVASWEAWLARRRTAAFESGLPQPHAGRLAIWAGCVTWWLVLHVVIVAGYLTVAWRSDAVGSPSVLTLAVQVAAVCGFCALGVAVGWWIRSPLGAPILGGILVVASTIDLSQYGMHFRGLTWFGSVRSLVGLELVPALVIYRLTFFVALILLVAAAVRRRLLGWIATATGIITAIAVAVPAVNPHQEELRPVSLSSHVCVGNPAVTRICGVPEWSSYYPGLITQINEIKGQLSGYDADLPTMFRVYGEAVPTSPEPRVAQIRLRASLLSQPAPRAVAIAEALILPFGCLSASSSPPSPDAQLISGALLGVALVELGIAQYADNYPADLVAQIRALPEADQKAWFIASYRTLWSCAQDGFALPRGISYPGFGSGG